MVTKKVRFKQAVPVAMDAIGVHIGTFQEKDEATIPASIADDLIRAGLAEEIAGEAGEAGKPRGPMETPERPGAPARRR